MKVSRLLLAGLASSLLCANVMADDQGSGKITFSGEVIDAPCTIAADDVDKTVDLGEITLAEITSAGKSTPVPVEIHLTDCSLTNYTTSGGVNVSKVDVTFSSTATTAEDIDLLNNTTSSGAEGVGVRLLTESEQNITLGQAEEVPLIVDSTEQTLTFKAQMETISGKTPTPGFVTANATYVLNYQ